MPHLLLRDVTHEWNAVQSKARGIVLLPIGWESHSSPEMGKSAREIINEQTLEKCDLLVGIFWTRIGTPTSEYASGTVEEIEKHIATGKPVMLYFSSQPVALDTVDPEQVAALKAFKESCKSRGLYESYDSLSEFKDKFYRHLQLKVNEHSLFKNAGPAPVGEIIESQTKLPPLNKEARILLKEASLDPQGTILHVRHSGGADIQTNKKSFIPSTDQRDVAKWEAALKQLVVEGLVESRGQKGQILVITSLGYQIADMIEL